MNNDLYLHFLMIFTHLKMIRESLVSGMEILKSAYMSDPEWVPALQEIARVISQSGNLELIGSGLTAVSEGLKKCLSKRKSELIFTRGELEISRGNILVGYAHLQEASKLFSPSDT